MSKAIVTKPIGIVTEVVERNPIEGDLLKVQLDTPTAPKMATIICPACNGRGEFIYTPKQVASDWVTISHETPCKKCDKTGRITGVIVESN